MTTWSDDKDTNIEIVYCASKSIPFRVPALQKGSKERYTGPEIQRFKVLRSTHTFNLAMRFG